ncbi:hypothetical protein ACFFJY_17620 [Fictibacillus aquaticus]|uniref:Aminotransferase yhxA n=1 Tax=Fictibacillus aquaticus TaxID=2021314 RepID=A0A235F7G7_9BACL|nr:hypothetical protein [Fictibacillus aquaticus]OYD56635.1 hypothetical protein CGZ90_16630 [Fictibacillus aquaticus]
MNKTKKLLAGLSSISLVAGLTACSDEELPPEPTDSECSDWDWDDSEGVYECDDTNSRYFGYYFYNGTYYRDTNSLHKSSKYKKYKSSSSFKGGKGFGSSSGGFGG